MGFDELTLTIDDREVYARSQGGAETRGDFELSQLHHDLINIFDEWLRDKKISRRRELKGLGSLLYQCLFPGPVDQLFDRCLREISDPDRLRLQLVFTSNSYELASIPWEFLYLPDSQNRRGYFLATHPRLVVSRYIPLGVDRLPLLRYEDALRLLIVISQPENLKPIAVKDVLKAIEKFGESNPLIIELLKNPTRSEFLDKLDSGFEPHILHYMGHGRYDRDKNEGQMALLSPDWETVDWVPDHIFADHFDRIKPSLVVLQACDGGKIDFTNNFAGLAPQLIRMEIPAVVAMQYPVKNMTAIAFSEIFYRALIDGQPVDGAVQEARRRITLNYGHNTRDFGTPVLYMRSRDGVIMHTGGKSAEVAHGVSHG